MASAEFVGGHMINEIRASKKDFKKLSKLKSRYDNKFSVPVEHQFEVLLDSFEESIIMLHIEEGPDKGKLIEWPLGRGYRNISTFLKKGYVFPKVLCPYSFNLFPCRGEKCALFMVHNDLGKCSHFFAGVK